MKSYVLRFLSISEFIGFDLEYVIRSCHQIWFGSSVQWASQSETAVFRITLHERVSFKDGIWLEKTHTVITVRGFRQMEGVLTLAT